MIALWFATMAAATDVSLHAGLTPLVPAPLEQSAVRVGVGVLAGTRVAVDPLRVEGQLTLGTRDREGTSEVWVSSSNLELALLGGWRGTLVGKRRFGLGLDALAGPALTRSVATATVFDATSRSTAWRPRLALSVGPWTRLGPVQIGARVQAYAPLAPQWGAFGTIGASF